MEKLILGKKGDLSFDERSYQRGISKGNMVAGRDKWSGFGDVFPSLNGNMEDDARYRLTEDVGESVKRLHF